MDLLELLLLALAGLALFVWLLAPLLVRLTFQHDMAPDLEPCGPADVPDGAADFLDPRVDDLQALGFMDCDRASLPGMRNTAVWFALLRNDPDELMACVSVGTLPVPGGEPRLHMGQVEFVSLWPDGREVLTSNLAQPVAIDPLPEHDLLQVPDEHDLARLLQIHEARLAQGSRGSPRPRNPAPGQEIATVEEVFHRTLEYQVERGWLWRDESRSRYRATLRGAWHMTARVLFPYAQIGRWRIAKQARHALEALGLRFPVTHV